MAAHGIPAGVLVSAYLLSGEEETAAEDAHLYRLAVKDARWNLRGPDDEDDADDTSASEIDDEELQKYGALVEDAVSSLGRLGDKLEEDAQLQARFTAGVKLIVRAGFGCDGDIGYDMFVQQMKLVLSSGGSSSVDKQDEMEWMSKVLEFAKSLCVEATEQCSGRTLSNFKRRIHQYTTQYIMPVWDSVSTAVVTG